jgi:hypothetical protein
LVVDDRSHESENVLVHRERTIRQDQALGLRFSMAPLKWLFGDDADGTKSPAAALPHGQASIRGTKAPWPNPRLASSAVANPNPFKFKYLTCQRGRSWRLPDKLLRLRTKGTESERFEEDMG